MCNKRLNPYTQQVSWPVEGMCAQSAYLRVATLQRELQGGRGGGYRTVRNCVLQGPYRSMCAADGRPTRLSVDLRV